MTEYILKTKNVNSKSLLTEISNFVGEIIDNFNIIWDSDSQRDAILEVVDEFMEDLKTNANKIEQWNVVCDARNNKHKDTKNKETHLDVYYCQRHCYNVTELCYTIKK